VFSEKYQLRSKWRNNKLRGPIPTAQAARQVFQMDSVLFGDVFAFTAINIFTKESNVLLRPVLETADGKAFLAYCMSRRFDGFSEIIQTDGGGEFKVEFSQAVDAYCDMSYPLRHFDVITKEKIGGKYAPRSQKRIKSPIQVCCT